MAKYKWWKHRKHSFLKESVTDRWTNRWTDSSPGVFVGEIENLSSPVQESPFRREYLAEYPAVTGDSVFSRRGGAGENPFQDLNIQMLTESIQRELQTALQSFVGETVGGATVPAMAALTMERLRDAEARGMIENPRVGAENGEVYAEYTLPLGQEINRLDINLQLDRNFDGEI